MISDLLIAYRGLVPVAFLLTALGCAGVGYLLLRSGRRGTRIAWSLTASSLLPVAALTLLPSLNSQVSGDVCTVQFDYPTFGRVELAANIALFVPLAFFATLATRRPLVVALAGSGLSAAIEALQALLPAIGRACDTNDWMMNTIGTVIGVLLAGGTAAVATRVGAGKADDPGRQPGW